MSHRRGLRFGVAITPAVGGADAAVELARRAEAAGQDLVVVADHADPAGELDAWTLLSVVAARTAAIELAAHLTLAPTLHPAVLAHAVASLDLLSGGRLAVVLGAQDPAPERIDEVLDVVAAVLDAGAPGRVRHLGEHYRVPDAQRGPLPAHRVPLLVTGSEQDLQRLAGRRADGWLARHADLAPGDLAAAMKIIDEEAARAGRETAEISRVLLVPPGLALRELLDLAVEGVDTFVLTTSAADAIDALEALEALEVFARQTAPALREAVARELPPPLTGVLRPAAVRAKRRAGIDYDALPASLARTAVEPGDLDHARVRSTYLRGGSPGLVLRPRTTAEVVEALAVVRAHPHVPFGLRSGGHGVSGRSTNDGGIVISLAAMDSIEVVDRRRRLVRIGPGARWADVAAHLAPHGWALTSGDHGGVGVGGLATAGGIGWLAREHGLTIDHLRAAEVVLADGTVVVASEEEDPDLFWAVRGAGANVGVVTSFLFAVDEVGDVGFAQLLVGADDPAALLVRWGAAVEAAPRSLSGQLVMGGPRAGRPGVARLMAVVDSDDSDTIIAALQPIAAVGPLLDQHVVLTPYAQVVADADDGPHQGQGEPVARSGLVEHLTPEVAAAAAAVLASGAVHWFQLRSVGGAVADVPSDATAYAHRSAGFSLVVMGSDARRVDAAWADLADHLQGLYLSFETDRSPARLTDAFPPATLARLRSLKRRVDPTALFRDNFAISPQEDPA